MKYNKVHISTIKPEQSHTESHKNISIYSYQTKLNYMNVSSDERPSGYVMVPVSLDKRIQQTWDIGFSNDPVM